MNSDKPVEWNELRKCQREVTGHARALSRVFRVGESLGERNGARCFNNLTSWAEDAPTLREVAKTHKALHPNGIPKLRPIVGASTGLTTYVGDLVSDLIE